jgi:hypothetical protein
MHFHPAFQVYGTSLSKLEQISTTRVIGSTDDLIIGHHLEKV